MAPAQRQVVVLQVTDAAQGVVWQRFYYGGPGVILPTNARAISVWPGATHADTRIAICGESYDQILPQAQATTGGNDPNGFIAVFDGSGILRWSHHLFGQSSGYACAITDVSIRVEETPSGSQEVVTYCGVSTHPIAGGWLAPERPFASFNGSSSGATIQGTSGWDGFVGRVSKGAFNHTVVFHSTVSGPDQDGLFGLAEIDENRFVVVGATELLGTTAPAAGFAFPGLAGAVGSHSLGVALLFDALPTRTGGNLLLENVAFVGDAGTGSTTHTHTLARDVVVRSDWATSSPASQFVLLVGSTDSATALTSYAPNNSFHGGTDGFIAGLWDNSLSPSSPFLLPATGRFFGGVDNDGLVGIHGWNEYDDHVVVAGFSQQAPGLPATDIVVESYFNDTTFPPFGGLKRIGEARISATGDERPAAMGATNATNAAAVTPFNTGPLGDSAGGGIAVDQRARVHVVGSTDGNHIPPQGGGRLYDAGTDALRLACDMLQPGIGRSDGTGVQGAFVLPSGLTGGTSPACALPPFGRRLPAHPAPVVRRVLIDYLGQPPAAGVTGSSILVSRPTLDSGNASIVLAGFQYGFPGVGLSSIPPVLLGNGVEMYTTDNPYIYVAGIGYPYQSYVEPLAPLPSPPTLGMPMTVQMFFYVPSLVPGGVGTPCPGATDLTATPALWMNL